MDKDNQEVEVSQEETTAKTYTEEEVQKMIQAESDRRVTAALKKKDKAARLASMSEEERLKERQLELDAKEKALNTQALSYETARQLEKKSLPGAAAAFLVTDSAETTKENIEAFEKMFNAAIEAEVGKRIATGAPKAKTNSGALTKETFKKMSIAEQAEIFNKDPQLYAKLSAL